MEKIKTAIDLKNAMNKGPEMLKSIGDCKQIYLEWYVDNFGYDDEQEEQLTLNKINNLKQTLKGNYYSEFILEEDYNIKIKNYEGDIKIPQDKLIEMYSNAVDSPYGDVKNLETVVDKSVRNAREITDIEVDPNIISKIEEEWKKKLYPSKVKAVPYKVNLYTSKGHFNEHLDTPEKDLVGTALISLWDKNNKNNSSLKLSDIQKERNVRWNPDESSCIMFYSDCPHEVNSYYDDDDKNIRATLAFKIFSINQESNFDEYKINTVISSLKNFNLLNKGFILEHDYSLETKSLKGCDAILVTALNKMGYELSLIPIMYNFTLESYHNEDDIHECKVFPLRETDINYLLELSEQEEIIYNNVEFYNLDGKHYVWKDERQAYSEYTGNESCPENINSIYVSRAIIITDLKEK